MIGLIISGLTNAISGYFQNKSEVSKAKANLKSVEIEAKTNIAKQVADSKLSSDRLISEWENKAVENLNFSWRDEFVTLVVLVPAILVFVPYFQPYVKNGFIILTNLPDWYVNLIYITVCAGLGLRSLNFFKRK